MRDTLGLIWSNKVRKNAFARHDWQTESNINVCLEFIWLNLSKKIKKIKNTSKLSGQISPPKQEIKIINYILNLFGPLSFEL